MHARFSCIFLGMQRWLGGIEGHSAIYRGAETGDSTSGQVSKKQVSAIPSFYIDEGLCLIRVVLKFNK